jgi:hypothetical protein
MTLKQAIKELKSLFKETPGTSGAYWVVDNNYAQILRICIQTLVEYAEKGEKK